MFYNNSNRQKWHWDNIFQWFNKLLIEITVVISAMNHTLNIESLRLPLFPTPCAPITAIFTSDNEDFFRRIPRVVILIDTLTAHTFTIPVYMIIIIHNCKSVCLFVCFSSRLCCDSVTFLSSLFTNRPTKANNNSQKLQMKWKNKRNTHFRRHTHTHLVSVCLGSSNRDSVFSFQNFSICLSLFRRRFSDCFPFCCSHKKKRKKIVV